MARVRSAAARLRGHVARTPLLEFNRPGAGRILFKPETSQPTGSFKVRGVLNWALQLTPDQAARGLSTFSAGNTALALGHAARILGTTARSLLPDYAPAGKVSALRAAGVEAVLIPFSRMAEWLFSAGWNREPWAFLHPWTESEVITGHATIGLELFEDLPDVEAVFIPVGGGALVSGVGSALKKLKPRVRVIGVQTESYPSLKASLAAGRPVWIEPRPTICDGVAVPFTTDQMYPLLRKVVDEVIVVSEQEVRNAIRHLQRSAGIKAEGAGALSLAAALRTPAAGRRAAVCLVTGGNA